MNIHAKLAMQKILSELGVARASVGITQQDQAAKTGLSRMTIQRMGADDADPLLSTVIAVAQTVGRDLELVEQKVATRAKRIVHTGLAHNRLRREAAWEDTKRETALAKTWEAHNKAASVGTDAVMKDLVPNHTQEQATAIATAIQWLGTDIGFAFLQEALGKAGYVVEKKVARGRA